MACLLEDLTVKDKILFWKIWDILEMFMQFYSYGNESHWFPASSIVVARLNKDQITWMKLGLEASVRPYKGGWSVRVKWV